MSKYDYRAYNYPCPACFAKPGDKCTRPTDTGRVDVSWVHLSRSDKSIEAEQEGKSNG